MHGRKTFTHIGEVFPPVIARDARLLDIQHAAEVRAIFLQQRKQSRAVIERPFDVFVAQPHARRATGLIDLRRDSGKTLPVFTKGALEARNAVESIVARAKNVRRRQNLPEPAVGVLQNARMLGIELRLVLRVEDVHGVDLYSSLCNCQRARKGGRIFTEGSQKHLGAGNAPPIKERQRLFIVFAQKERRGGDADLHQKNLSISSSATVSIQPLVQYRVRMVKRSRILYASRNMRRTVSAPTSSCEKRVGQPREASTSSA